MSWTKSLKREGIGSVAISMTLSFCVILLKNPRSDRRVMVSVTRYLMHQLKRKVNRHKSQICKIEQLEYLGFTFQGIRIFVCDRALRDFKQRLRGLTNRSWGVSMTERLERLNRYLRGWMNYFGISQYYRPIEELDGWLRRRIRMCCWKQTSTSSAEHGADQDDGLPTSSNWK